MRSLPVLLAALALAPACSKPPEPPPAPRPSSIADLTSIELTATSTPPGARILLDGADSGKRTPQTLTLATGKDYVVELLHEDFLPYQEKVFAAPKQPLTIDAKLLPGARVSVTSEPAGARVMVDGKDAFATPGVSPLLAPGKHVLIAAAPGRCAARREFELVGGQPQEWAVVLTPGLEVEVSSEPPGAALEVDGVPTGQLTPAKVVVGLGKQHTVGVRLEGHVPSAKALPPLKARSKPPKIELTLETVRSKELRERLAEIRKQIAAKELQLRRLRSEASGGLVGDARMELAARRGLPQLERELEDLEAEALPLRAELERLQAGGEAR